MSESTTASDLPDGLGERIADWYAELTWRRGSTLVQPDDRIALVAERLGAGSRAG